MIQPLLDEVERLRRVMLEHGQYLSKTESATRYALIDPVLSMLGWDVHDAKCVLAEYRSGAAVTKFVDYALMADSAPVTLIEAKAHGAKLALKELEQLSNYCVNCQPRPVRWGILTNGDHWQLVDTHKVQVPLPRRIVLDFSITVGPAIHAVKHLVDLFGWVVAQSEPALAPQPKAGSATEPGQSPAGGPDAAAKGPQALLERAVAGGAPPSAVVLGGGDPVATKSWASVLRATALWLSGSARLTAAHCPLTDASGKKRRLVHTEARHEDGAEFKGPCALPGGLQLETNYSAANCVRNVLRLLAATKTAPSAFRWMS